MVQISTWVNVPADRRVTITLPPEVPVGPVAVQLTVEPPAPDPGAVGGGPTADAKFNLEWAAFHQLLPELLKTHRGQFVAIHDGQVIGSGDDKVRVGDEARRRSGGATVLVRLVSEEPEVVQIPSVWKPENVKRW
jgi:hypothetical protein